MIIGTVVTVPPTPPPPRNPCSPNPCQNGGTCSQTNTGSFMCLCPAGYGGYCCEIRELFSRKKTVFFTSMIDNHR